LVGKILLIMRWLEIVEEVSPSLIISVLFLKEIQANSPTGFVRLRIWIIHEPCEGCIHMFGQYLMSKINMTLFEHMVHNLIVSAARRCGLCWTDLVH